MVWILLVCVFAVDRPVENTEDIPRVSLAGVKCVVSGKPATRYYFARFKQGRVYFDCNSSRLKFESNRNEFVTKANHQLVITEQYVQSRCPYKLAGVSTDSPSFQIAGVRIRTCCSGCLFELNAEKTDIQQIEFLFSDMQFKKIFEQNPKISNANAAISSLR